MEINGCLIAAIFIFMILIIAFSCSTWTKKLTSSFLSSRTEGLDGVVTGRHGTHKGDHVSEDELYLDKYDHMAGGIDPEVQASQDEYVREQDMVVVSRGAAGPHATEVDHLSPPNVIHGLSGFRQFYHDAYTLPDARQMPSDDPGSFYSSNPTAHVLGNAF